MSETQVMAAFIALPPLIQIIWLLPRFGRWFANLTWVRVVCCCQCRRRKRARDDPVSLETMVPSGCHDTEEDMKRDLSTSLYKEPHSYS